MLRQTSKYKFEYYGLAASSRSRWCGIVLRREITAPSIEINIFSTKLRGKNRILCFWNHFQQYITEKRFLMSGAYICCLHCFCIKTFFFSFHFRRLFLRGLVTTLKFCSYFWRVTFAGGHEFLNVKRILGHACALSKIRVKILRKTIKDKT